MNDVNVPEGYKSTDIGVIPEDWEVDRLSSVSNVKTGPFGSALHEKDYVEDGTPIITVEHLGEPRVLHGNFPMVSDLDKQRLKAYELKIDDIVFSRVGSVDRNSLITNEEDGWLFSSRLLRIRPNKKQIFSTFLSYFFHYEPSKQRIKSVAVGQTMPSLNTQILNNFPIPLPPLPEQKAIARVLSDVDDLIRECDSLLAKKRDIKQGTMQQLLTGKKRLPGFSGDWEVKCFNSFAYLSKSRINPQYTTKSYHCIELEHLSQDTGRLLGFIESKEQLSQKSIFSKGDVLFGKLRPYLKKFHFTKFSGVCSSEIWVIKSLDNAIGEFIFYLVQSNKFLESANQTSGTKMPRSDWKIVSSDEYFLPTLAEQKAIAEILSDMDAEIEALEQKRDKYKAIKQGMMQELLTGKTRINQD
jgi:type I restriction enzyme, S subunit